MVFSIPFQNAKTTGTCRAQIVQENILKPSINITGPQSYRGLQASRSWCNNNLLRPPPPPPPPPWKSWICPENCFWNIHIFLSFWSSEQIICPRIFLKFFSVILLKKGDSSLLTTTGLYSTFNLEKKKPDSVQNGVDGYSTREALERDKAILEPQILISPALVVSIYILLKRDWPQLTVDVGNFPQDFADGIVCICTQEFGNINVHFTQYNSCRVLHNLLLCYDTIQTSSTIYINLGVRCSSTTMQRSS